MRPYLRVGIAVLSTYAAGLIGSLFVSTSVGSWYDTLEKPAFTPPTWIFLPVWLVLYACMSVACILVWRRDEHAEHVQGWVPLYFMHLLINAAWTMFFFGLHAPLIAFIVAIVLGFAVAFLTFGAYEIDKRAAFFLAPYFAWVLFATLLTGLIWYLN